MQRDELEDRSIGNGDLGPRVSADENRRFIRAQAHFPDLEPQNISLAENLHPIVRKYLAGNVKNHLGCLWLVQTDSDPIGLALERIFYLEGQPQDIAEDLIDECRQLDIFDVELDVRLSVIQHHLVRLIHNATYYPRGRRRRHAETGFRQPCTTLSNFTLNQIGSRHFIGIGRLHLDQRIWKLHDSCTTPAHQSQPNGNEQRITSESRG
ncbi:hypothetical protein FQZ97_437960 [compost metagenome]